MFTCLSSVLSGGHCDQGVKGGDFRYVVLCVYQVAVVLNEMTGVVYQQLYVDRNGENKTIKGKAALKKQSKNCIVIKRIHCVSY